MTSNSTLSRVVHSSHVFHPHVCPSIQHIVTRLYALCPALLGVLGTG